MKKWPGILAMVLVVVPLLLPVTGAAATVQTPFARGFNLGGWFQGASAQDITNFNTITDLENMVALGADHVRVPIDLRNMSGDGPSYTIDPILFMYLDRLVDWCEALGLYVILDNHTLLSLDADPESEARTVTVWRQMAAHFADRSELVLYEILNEPIGMPTWEWGRIQQKAIDAIRAVDTTHTIIVSPAEMGSYDELRELPWYDDDNLIYTFHFYDPFLFTHQGTYWTDPSMETLSGVPYPYSASRMPSMPRSFSGTWLAQQWDWYADAGTAASLADRMSVPVRFGTQRRALIYCGEFGVWAPAAAHADVVRWYADVRALLDADGIGWAMLDDTGPFGIYEQDSNQVFPDDLDLEIVRALGLNVPAPPAIEPETTAWVIYDDLVSGYLFDGGHGGTLDLYDRSDPAEGAYCVRWTNASRYSVVSWRLSAPRDLSLLAAEGWRLRFWVKSDTLGMSFDLRFLDTDTGGQDHPWRMAKTIDSSLVPMDGAWHQIEFALRDMLDVGAFDDGTWYGSEGTFDWSRIERFEIAAEQQSLSGKNLWLDGIEIVAPAAVDASDDTADTGAASSANLLANGDFSDGMANWDSYVHASGGVDAQFIVYGGALHAYILGVGAEAWYIQLIQHGIPLESGKTYAVELTASADSARTIHVGLTRDSGDYGSYATETIALTTQPTTYRFTFTMTAADPAARFVVEMGTSDVNVKLANLSVSEQ